MTMPREKDLKRLVRARMKKTGEAYTAARAQIIKKTATKKSSTGATAAPAISTRKIDYAALAGMSDAVVKEKTGCTWKAWVGALDYHGAAKMSHAEIAKLIKTEFEVGSWWTQMVTVGYERIKGLRARGQQRDGTFGATKSRTFNVPVETLFNAWKDATTREQWLPGQAFECGRQQRRNPCASIGRTAASSPWASFRRARAKVPSRSSIPSFPTGKRSRASKNTGRSG